MRDPSPFLANPRILKTIHACPSIRATDDLFETALSHIPDFFQVRQAESFPYNSHHNFICLFNARSHRFCGAKEPSVSQRLLGTPNVYLEKIRSIGQDLAGTPHFIGEHLPPQNNLRNAALCSHGTQKSVDKGTGHLERLRTGFQPGANETVVLNC